MSRIVLVRRAIWVVLVAIPGDPDQVDNILDQVDSVIDRFVAYGAYDGDPVYDAVRRHFPDPLPEVIIPPRSTAVLSSEVAAEQIAQDCRILELRTKGRMAWQKAHDYGKRSLVETAIGRYKSIIDNRLHARHDDAQPVKLAIGIKVLNQMMNQTDLRQGWISFHSRDIRVNSATRETKPCR